MLSSRTAQLYLAATLASHRLEIKPPKQEELSGRQIRTKPPSFKAFLSIQTPDFSDIPENPE